MMGLLPSPKALSVNECALGLFVILLSSGVISRASAISLSTHKIVTTLATIFLANHPDHK